jgi:hypothetical protein
MRPRLLAIVCLLGLTATAQAQKELWSNNGTSTLASGIGTGATSISVASGQGARFPSIAGSDYFYATLVEGTTIEIVKVTARATDTLTVTRAQCGTSAATFTTAAKVENRLTKCGLEDLQTPAQSATFITETTSSALASEFALASLGTGLLKNTTTTGVPTIYGGTSCTNQFPRSLDASGAATCATVSLTADITGTLGAGNGGTGNAFFAVSGPASSTKTFTFPNSTTTVHTQADGYILTGIQIVQTGTTTYTATAGTRGILVECVGGGAGGGSADGAASSAGAGGGGGSGSYARKWITTLASPYTVSVGAAANGGVAQANGAAGTNGNATTFGSPAVLTCNGGTGGSASGTAAATVLVVAGGAGGAISTGGDFNVIGEPGGPGIRLAAAQEIGGNGGSSVLSGGAAGTVNAAVTNATGFGGGGGGAGTNGNTDRPGGNGAPGVIFVWEYR